MCADSWETGEHSCGPVEPVPGGREDHASGAYSRNEGIWQPCLEERGAWPDYILHRV